MKKGFLKKAFAFLLTASLVTPNAVAFAADGEMNTPEIKLFKGGTEVVNDTEVNVGDEFSIKFKWASEDSKEKGTLGNPIVDVNDGDKM